MMLDEAQIAMGIDHPNVARTRADIWSLGANGANDANDANDAARLVAKRPKTPSSDGAHGSPGRRAVAGRNLRETIAQSARHALRAILS